MRGSDVEQVLSGPRPDKGSFVEVANLADRWHQFHGDYAHVTKTVNTVARGLASQQAKSVESIRTVLTGKISPASMKILDTAGQVANTLRTYAGGLQDLSIRASSVKGQQKKWKTLQQDRIKLDERVAKRLQATPIGKLTVGHPVSTAAGSFEAMGSGAAMTASQVLMFLQQDRHDPAKIVQDWAMLSDTEKFKLLNGEHSDFLGNLNGIPYKDRDTANKATFTRVKTANDVLYKA